MFSLITQRTEKESREGEKKKKKKLEKYRYRARGWGGGGGGGGQQARSAMFRGTNRRERSTKDKTKGGKQENEEYPTARYKNGGKLKGNRRGMGKKFNKTSNRKRVLREINRRNRK